METWQILIIIASAVYSLLCFIQGFRNTYFKKNPYGLSTIFNPIGAFVWADAVVFGLFFFLAAFISLLLQNILIFLLIYSVFWVVRSIGEQIYWFLEQFAEKHKNKPGDLRMSEYFPGESIYIYYQIFWQCVSVIAIISSVYLFSLFLKG